MPVHNVLFYKRSFQKWERQGLVGSLSNRPTCRARLRSRTTASSAMCHIASTCMSYMHVYLATHGCQCSPVGPRRAPDPPAKVQERLRETCTCRVKASMRETRAAGPIVSSSDCLYSLGKRPMTRWKVVWPRLDEPEWWRCLCIFWSSQLHACSVCDTLQNFKRMLPIIIKA